MAHPKLAIRILLVTSLFIVPAVPAQSRVAGLVLSASDGKPLGAEIAVSGRNSEGLFFRHVFASADGSFQLEDLPKVAIHLTTKLKGYAPEHVTLIPGDNESSPIQFYLKRGRTITGVVFDDGQNRLARATVSLYYRREVSPKGAMWTTYQWEMGQVSTDDSGTFVLTDVHPEKEFVLEASHPDFLTTVSAPLSMSEPAVQTLLEVRLARGLTLQGTVRQFNGLPVGGAMVRLLQSEWGDVAHFSPSALGRQRAQAVVTDSDGAFRFDKVEPMRSVLLVSGPQNRPYHQNLDLTRSSATVQLAVVVN